MRTSILTLALVLATGCGGDATGSSGGGSGDDGADAGPKPSAFGKEKLQELADREIPGWTKHPPMVKDTYVQFSVKRETKTEKGLTYNVLVRIAACPDIELCFSLDPENRMNKMWGKQSREMVAKQAQDGIVEYGAMPLQDGRKALGLYTCAFQVSDDGKSRSSNLGLQLRYHDGGNAIRMMISASGPKDVANSQELSALMTKDAALAAAREIFAVYADDFGK